jgi:hypothetical protein
MVGEEIAATTKSKATILRRPGKKWAHRDVAILGCSHRVAVCGEDGETLVVEGHHGKAEIAKALSFDPNNLGNNDFDCEPTEIEIPSKNRALH